MKDECVFCRIAAGEIPAKEVYRDAAVLAIADANPQAPVHLLVMPIAHHRNLDELVEAHDEGTLLRLFVAASKLGREHGGDGFRLVVNTGPDGGQTVGHLHVHVLAGRGMTWPPG